MKIERQDLVIAPWEDYELIDSGLNRKLERYGKYIIVRPETQALWQPRVPDAWKRADAEFHWEDGKGSWQKKDVPDEWTLAWHDARFIIRLTSFKHTGVFPEQAANWGWIHECVRMLGGRHGNSARSDSERPQVLNLFGYTGIASVIAAQAGAFVTHVDASKQSNAWAKENAKLSGLPDDGIRYILDDALRFVLREARRGAAYEGIILDPPAFGRGPKGEIWRIEEHLPALLAALEKIFKKSPGSFFLLNGYAAGYSPHSFLQAMEGAAWTKTNGSQGTLSGEFGELAIKESGLDRYVPSGIYTRFTVH